MSVGGSGEPGEVGDPGLTETEYRERLEDLPPSAKLVAKVLERDAPLSKAQVAERSLLPDRTVRYALNRLAEVDVVDSRYSFTDARKRVYSLRRQS